MGREVVIKLSIFPKAKPLPKDKDEKDKESRYASRPHLPKTVEISDSDTLIETVTSYVWSPSIFKEARLQEDFLSADFLVLDVDKGLTIEQAEERITEANITCLCAPSTSHTPEAHRFRLIFPLSRTIHNVDDYLATMDTLVDAFPECDIQVAHNFVAFYFASRLDDGFWIEGELLEPVKATPRVAKKGARNSSSESKIKVDSDIKELIDELYGEDREYIPECVDFFIKNAHTGLSGEWVLALNSFCYVLSLQGIEEDTIYDIVEYLAPDNLDKRDRDVIRRAFRDGERDREEE